MRTFYDEFKNMPVDKMAQQIEDITYLYKGTEVPKKHYKTHLATAMEEVISNSVEINLIEHYVKALENLKKENEKLFYKAFLTMELSIKVSKITPKEHNALGVVYLAMQQDKTPYLNPQVKDMYQQALDNDMISDFL